MCRPAGKAASYFDKARWNICACIPISSREYSWGERWRLISAAFRFSRGTGKVPGFRLPFPAATFESQQRPLGHLPETVLKPLNTYFETAVVSWRYAMMKRHGWSMIDSFWALVLGYSVGMWVLRMACGDHEPDVQDVVGVVMMLDRGQTHASLAGYRHRLRTRALSHNDQLAPLAAWYAR